MDPLGLKGWGKNGGADWATLSSAWSSLTSSHPGTLQHTPGLEIIDNPSRQVSGILFLTPISAQPLFSSHSAINRYGNNFLFIISSFLTKIA